MKLLVIIARGLRAGALACYANSLVQTPSLDALAAEGIVFDWHFADLATAAGARRAWRTGRPAFLPVAEADDLLASLRRVGVSTRLIVDTSAPTVPQFEEGWDRVKRMPGLEAVVGKASEYLNRAAGSDDWLLWVELPTPLPPWTVPEEIREFYFGDRTHRKSEPADEEDEEDEDFDERETLEIFEEPPATLDPDDDEQFLSLYSSYAAAVTYLDVAVGELLKTLDEMGEAGSDVTVLFTSDHGFPLGEHGVAGVEKSQPYEELVHLPLILRLPHRTRAGARVAVLTQSADLGPTIAGLFGANLAGATGVDLVPILKRKVELKRESLRLAAPVGAALRTPGWSLLLPPDAPPQLFVKPDDAWEVNDVAGHNPERVESMEQTLRALIEEGRPG
jgi:arylsulfatase A-like enzyme